MATGVLLVAVLVCRPIRRQAHFVPSRSVEEILDCELPPGWLSRTLPFGDTEVANREIESVLRFSDAAFRSYKGGGLEVEVYMAYWEPGKMDPWIVSLHTPDTCWVLSGCEELYRDNNWSSEFVALQTNHPGRMRRYRLPTGGDVEVVYWHLYGGVPSGLPIPTDQNRLLARMRELRTTLTNTQWGRIQREQVFIRISTNRTLREVAESDLWPFIESSLAPTGLTNKAR